MTFTASVPWLAPYCPTRGATRLRSWIGLILRPAIGRRDRRGDADVVRLLGVVRAALGAARRVAHPLGARVDRVRHAVGVDGARLVVVGELRHGHAAHALLIALGEGRGGGPRAVDGGRGARGVERGEDGEDDAHQHEGADQRLDEGHAVLGGELGPVGTALGVGDARRLGGAHMWHGIGSPPAGLRSLDTFGRNCPTSDRCRVAARASQVPSEGAGRSAGSLGRDGMEAGEGSPASSVRVTRRGLRRAWPAQPTRRRARGPRRSASGTPRPSAPGSSTATSGSSGPRTSSAARRCASS